MPKEALTRVRIVSNTERIGLTCLSDMIILDKHNQIIAMRIGGYPESVQAMSGIIVTGCDLQLQRDGQTVRASSKGGRKYKRYTAFFQRKLPETVICESRVLFGILSKKDLFVLTVIPFRK